VDLCNRGAVLFERVRDWTSGFIQWTLHTSNGVSSMKIFVTKTNIFCTHDVHEPATLSSIYYPNNIKHSVKILKLKYSSCHFLEFFIAYISPLPQNILLSICTSRRHCNTFISDYFFYSTSSYMLAVCNCTSNACMANLNHTHMEIPWEEIQQWNSWGFHMV